MITHTHMYRGAFKPFQNRVSNTTGEEGVKNDLTQKLFEARCHPLICQKKTITCTTPSFLFLAEPHICSTQGKFTLNFCSKSKLVSFKADIIINIYTPVLCFFGEMFPYFL